MSGGANPRRALEVINTSRLSGGAEHLRRLAGPLIEAGWEVTIACPADGPVADSWRGLGAKVEHVDMMRRRVNPGAILELRRLMLRLRPDLIHCHGTRAAFLGGLARRAATRAPMLYTVHGFSFRKEMTGVQRGFYLLVEKLLCRTAGRVIFVSQADADEARRRGLAGRTPCSVIPNGVDARRFAPRRAMSGSPDSPLVVTVARLVPQKGIEYLIDAAAIVHRESPGCRFQIVGDGPLLPALRARARSLGLDETLFFTGASAQVEEILAAADIFVLPSLWEGLPMALLEAMAAGLPVVATDTSGSREIIERTGAGILVPCRNAEAPARAILSLLADPSAARRMGEAAREAVVKYYSEDDMIRRTLAVYDWAIGLCVE